MRDILFRGKHVDNGEWVTGTPFIEANCCKMITAVALHPDFVDEGNVYFSEGFPVRQETVGQYTGLTDKNGKKIFEGDIVNCVYVGDLRTYIVVWDKDESDFKAISSEESYRHNVQYLCCCDEVEIIGNIFDNPELLENNNLEEHKNGQNQHT